MALSMNAVNKDIIALAGGLSDDSKKRQLDRKGNCYLQVT